MKKRWFKRLTACVLAGALVFNFSALSAFAADSAQGKYVSNVFIAYGKTEEDAAKWLTQNGWEPVPGDFNAGKASFFDNNKLQDQNVAAVMGIKRTDKADEAITDMAVMNMKGGYSLPAYESLIKEKKAQIDEIINDLMPAIHEYRANKNSEGSEIGEKRAQTAYEMLNKYTDGDPEGEYAVHDTGKRLGDLLATDTMQEGNESGLDLQQLMLESSGPAMLTVEMLLALGTDTAEDTWLQRASGLTGDALSENLEKYVPEAAGQDVAASAAVQYLNGKFADTAVLLAEQWEDVHEEILWFESYNDQNGLWKKDKESDDAYTKRLMAHFKALEGSDSDNGDRDHYYQISVLYNKMYDIPYEGEWGETLGDFLNPAGDDAFAYVPENYLPLAAGLSEGQRACLEFVSFEAMLSLGIGTPEEVGKLLPDVKKLLGDAVEMDIYAGVNRAIFRSGVALTNEALMEQNAGRGQAFDQLWSNSGIIAWAVNAGAILGAVTLVTGGIMTAKGYTAAYTTEEIAGFKQSYDTARTTYYNHIHQVENGDAVIKGSIVDNYTDKMLEYENAQKAQKVTGMGTAGRWMMGIGGALMIGAAIVKGVQMYQYYQRTFTPIPTMIVDESDIVTYLTDDNGKPLLDEKGDQKKNIDFKDYEYYQAVSCNRPEVGEIGDWQDGVKEYQDHGCYNVADLNADMGQEWLALYATKSENKGYPILADSLTLQYGSGEMPAGCSQALHLFTYTNAQDLGDTAWAFNNDKKGVYFFWNSDENAYPASAASAFSTGHMAMGIAIGLAVGILGATLALYPKRKREEAPEL